MALAVLLLAVLPVVNGVCAGFLLGRAARSPRAAMRRALIAAVPLAAIVLLIVPRIAVNAAPLWLFLTLVPLLGGTWLGAVTRARTPARVNAARRQE